jgi:hypothetical protein
MRVRRVAKLCPVECDYVIENSLNGLLKGEADISPVGYEYRYFPISHAASLGMETP